MADDTKLEGEHTKSVSAPLTSATHADLEARFKIRYSQSPRIVVDDITYINENFIDFLRNPLAYESEESKLPQSDAEGLAAGSIDDKVETGNITNVILPPSNLQVLSRDYESESKPFETERHEGYIYAVNPEGSGHKCSRFSDTPTNYENGLAVLVKKSVVDSLGTEPSREPHLVFICPPSNSSPIVEVPLTEKNKDKYDAMGIVYFETQGPVDFSGLSQEQLEKGVIGLRYKQKKR